MTARQLFAAVGLAAFLSGYTYYHAERVIQSKGAIVRLDPTFIRITHTTNASASCGRFESGRNRTQFPNGERFYWIGLRLITESQAQEAKRQGDPVRGFPDCQASHRGGWLAAISDPILLPIVGSVRS
jgi:hypothetical protein